MTIEALWIAMPLLLLAGGALTVLLLGAVAQGRHTVWTAVSCCIGAALWSLQTPPEVQEPFGLTATVSVRFFTIFFCLLAAAVLIVSGKSIDETYSDTEEYPATVLFAAFGMIVVAGAQDLLMLFLGLESMTFGFYILVAMDLKRSASGEAGLKYLLIGAVAAGFLAFGLALLYFVSGSLDVATAMEAVGREPLAMVGWGLVLIGIAFKLSLVPAHLWTPDIYQGAPAAVVAFLSGGSKGAAILFTVTLLRNVGDNDRLRFPLLAFSLLSMLIGNLAALRQDNIRRMLAYSAVAQMGYVALALACGGAGGFRAALYYAVVYALMNFAAFGAVAVFERNGFSGLISGYRGGGAREPFAAAVLALAMFALAGIPPTAGFTGKFMIFAAALKGGETVVAVIGILTAAVSAYYYLRIVVNLYMVRGEETGITSVPSCANGVLLLAVLLILVAGLFPSPLLDLIAPDNLPMISLKSAP